jgi:hypothetical protein
MGQQLSQVYSDSLKHTHSLIYSDCYETCAVALIKSTFAILGIPLFQWTREIDEVPSLIVQNAFSHPKPFKDPNSSPWSTASRVHPLER